MRMLWMDQTIYWSFLIDSLTAWRQVSIATRMSGCAINESKFSLGQTKCVPIGLCWCLWPEDDDANQAQELRVLKKRARQQDISQREFTSAFVHSALNEQEMCSAWAASPVRRNSLWIVVALDLYTLNQEETGGVFLDVKTLEVPDEDYKLLKYMGGKLIYWTVLFSLCIFKVGSVCFLIVSTRFNMHASN